MLHILANCTKVFHDIPFHWVLGKRPYQFFMLMSMLTITLLKSRYSSLKLIQDHYPELFKFFRRVISELIWGKLQRSPSPLPTYLKSKRLVNTHISWSMCCKRFMQPEWVFWTVVACHWCIPVPLIDMLGPSWQGARMFGTKLIIVRSGWAAGGGGSCSYSPV